MARVCAAPALSTATEVVRLRGPGEVLRADLSHPRVARAGEGRGGAACRTERQGGAAARSDLRRREDAHADHAPSSVPRSARTAGSARGPGVPRARRHGSAGGVPGDALFRQDRRRARCRGSARSGRGNPHAAPPLERAGVPARRRGWTARNTRRRAGRGAGDSARGAAAGRTAGDPPPARAGDPGPGRRGLDVRPREGGPRSRLARAHCRFLPVSDTGRGQGRHRGDGRLDTRDRPAQAARRAGQPADLRSFARRMPWS